MIRILRDSDSPSSYILQVNNPPTTFTFGVYDDTSLKLLKYFINGNLEAFNYIDDSGGLHASRVNDIVTIRVSVYGGKNHYEWSIVVNDAELKAEFARCQTIT